MKSVVCTTLLLKYSCSIAQHRLCSFYTFEKRRAATLLKSVVATLLCLQWVAPVVWLSIIDYSDGTVPCSRALFLLGSASLASMRDCHHKCGCVLKLFISATFRRKLPFCSSCLWTCLVQNEVCLKHGWVGVAADNAYAISCRLYWQRQCSWRPPERFSGTSTCAKYILAPSSCLVAARVHILKVVSWNLEW